MCRSVHDGIMDYRWFGPYLTPVLKTTDPNTYTYTYHRCCSSFVRGNDVLLVPCNSVQIVLHVPLGATVTIDRF